MADLPMKHFTDETRARIAALEARAARLYPTCGNAGGARGGAAYPEHEMDPAEQRGPAALRELVENYGPVCVSQPHARLTLGEDGSMNYQLLEAQIYSYAPEGWPEGELDPAALLGPAAEPVDWPERDSAGDEEC